MIAPKVSTSSAGDQVPGALTAVLGEPALPSVECASPLVDPAPSLIGRAYPLVDPAPPLIEPPFPFTELAEIR